MVSTLPNPAAQQSFSMLALRHEGYALSDANLYSASQIKEADKNSAYASQQVAVSNSGNMSVALDDKRFDDNLHDINFATVRQMQTQGWDQGTGMQMDPKTGEVSFDTSNAQGVRAKAVYDEIQDKANGAAWKNRLETLSNQNVALAYQKFQDNRDRIPGQAQAELTAYFTPKIRNFQARDISDQAMTKLDQDYGAAITDKNTPSTAGDIDHAIVSQESRGNPNSPDSVDGAVGRNQIIPATFARFAKPGEDMHNPADNDAVAQRYRDYLKQKFNNDPQRVAVAYFSGEGNVAPAGSPTAWVNDTKDGNGKSVSSYVSDVMGRMNKGVPPSPGEEGPFPAGQNSYTTKADYIRSNWTNIIDNADAQARSLHPDDPTFADEARARVETRLKSSLQDEYKSYKADQDTVLKAVDSGKISTMDQLTQSSPDAQAAINRIMVQQPDFYRSLQTRIVNNQDKAHGQGYSATESRLFLPSTDPKAITDPSQLWPLVSSGQITYRDQKDFAEVLEKMQDPKSAMEQTAKKNVVSSVLDQIVPKHARDSGFFSQEENSRMQNARLAIQQADQDAIKAGKTAMQRYSPDSKDYVGNAARPFLQSAGDKVVSAVQNAVSTTSTTPTISKSPAIGEVQKGYKFLGGDPKDKNSWVKQ
jgi:hypothetical protein